MQKCGRCNYLCQGIKVAIPSNRSVNRQFQSANTTVKGIWSMVLNYILSDIYFGINYTIPYGNIVAWICIWQIQWKLLAVFHLRTQCLRGGWRITVCCMFFYFSLVSSFIYMFSGSLGYLRNCVLLFGVFTHRIPDICMDYELVLAFCL